MTKIKTAAFLVLRVITINGGVQRCSLWVIVVNFHRDTNYHLCYAVVLVVEMMPAGTQPDRCSIGGRGSGQV